MYIYIYINLFNDLKFSKGKNNNHNMLFGILNTDVVVGLSESWSWSSSDVNLKPIAVGPWATPSTVPAFKLVLTTCLWLGSCFLSIWSFIWVNIISAG